jgi:hypothetical protein
MSNLCETCKKNIALFLPNIQSKNKTECDSYVGLQEMQIKIVRVLLVEYSLDKAIALVEKGKMEIKGDTILMTYKNGITDIFKDVEGEIIQVY